MSSPTVHIAEAAEVRADYPQQPVVDYDRHRTIFSANQLSTPRLLLDLDVVAAQYRHLQLLVPGGEIYYAVKANAEPAVLSLLTSLGCGFDVASPGEIAACLRAGASPDRLSYGHPVKKSADISHAFGIGIRLFAFDSAAELDKLALAAPGCEVMCRVTVGSAGAQWPISRKFGCAPHEAVSLLRYAQSLGLRPAGITFHVGSQQREPARWHDAIGVMAGIISALAAEGIGIDILNVGGGLPARYDPELPNLASYAQAMLTGLQRHELAPSRLIVEPGRYLVADAGLIRSEVVLAVTRAEPSGHRWIYVDVGRFSGLAETEGEAIRFPLVAMRGDRPAPGPLAEAVVAGPTCDSADTLYELNRPLLAQVSEGDYLDFLATGAYTSTYSSVGFNGFEPLPTSCFAGSRPQLIAAEGQP
ncbi:MAG: type III PLP-dependent enzyme [Jatrophihabitantaceae bacterium]